MRSFSFDSISSEDKLYAFYKDKLLPRLSEERFNIDELKLLKKPQFLEFDDDWEVLLYFIKLRYGRIENPAPVLDIDNLWPSITEKEQKENRYIKLVEPLLTLEFNRNRLIGEIDKIKDNRDFTRYLKRVKYLHHLLQPLKQSPILHTGDSQATSTLSEKLFVFIQKCIFTFKNIFSSDKSIKSNQMIDEFFIIFEDFHAYHAVDTVKNTFYQDLKEYYDELFIFSEKEMYFFKSPPNPNSSVLNWLYKLVDWGSRNSYTIKKFEQDKEKLKQRVLLKFRSALMWVKIDPNEGMKAYIEAYHFLQTGRQELSTAVWEYRKRCEKEWRQSRFISERQYLAQLERFDAELLNFDIGLKKLPDECFENIQNLAPSFSLLAEIHSVLKHMHDAQIMELADAINWVHHACYSANSTEGHFNHELNTLLRLNPDENLTVYSLKEAYTMTDILVDKLESIYNDTRHDFNIITHPDKAPSSIQIIAKECFQYVSGLYDQAKRLVDIWRGGQWSIAKTLGLPIDNSTISSNLDTPSEIVYVDKPKRCLDLGCLIFKDEYIKSIKNNVPLNKPSQNAELSSDYQLYDGDSEASLPINGSDRGIWETSRAILFYNRQAEFDIQKRLELEKIIKEEQAKKEDAIGQSQALREDVKKHELREKLSERLYLIDPSNTADEMKMALEKVIHEVYGERIIRVFEISLEEVSEAALNVISTNDNLHFIIEDRTSLRMI